MEPESPNENERPSPLKKAKYKIATSQWTLFFTILAIGCAGIVYAYLKESRYLDSAALYIGLPLILALGMSLTPKSESGMGATMKGITIALVLAAPIFREGYICILFSAPIFYLIGFLIAWGVGKARKHRDKHRKLQSAFISTMLAVMALEGTSEMTSFPRDHEVEVIKTVPASLAAVRQALAKSPSLGKQKPFFLRIFPYPVAMEGEGLNVGDTRRATFVAYKHIFWNRVEGDQVFAITEATDRKITSNLVSDTSYVGHYLDWKTSQVELTPLNATHTQVTWRLSFHRKYDPYWYFGTLQKYAARLVAEELIDHAATPHT